MFQDAAALAAAKERVLSKGDEKFFNEIASTYIYANYSDINPKTVSIKTTVLEDPFSVTVQVSEKWTPFFSHFLSTGVTPVTTEATANLAGAGFVCVVGLMNYKSVSSIHLDQKSYLKAENCGVYSNSPSKTGLRADRNSKIRAHSICSVGGYYQHKGVADVVPEPITDCPKIDDPLGDRPAPNVGACDYNDTIITADTRLNPGTYCDGIKIDGDARVTLNSGVYVIKDGSLEVNDDASLTGSGVGFFMTGENSLFNFAKETKIDLSAPVTGELAGILFYEDRNTPYSFKKFNPLKPWETLDEKGKNKAGDGVRIHVISSDFANNLLGTFYLPNSILLINSEKSVADESAYTAIITARLWLQEGPTLVLNSDYKSTNVPVPENLINDTVVLAK